MCDTVPSHFFFIYVFNLLSFIDFIYLSIFFMQMSIKLKQRMKNEQRLNVSAQTSSSLFSRREGKKCSAEEMWCNGST